MDFSVAEYEVLKTENLKEIESKGLVLQHKKSGARVVVISNEDDNKVFSIGFRTPPKNSTGVPHIIEHTVLCGSKTFPAKDPFIELSKGSLNTFLNAMTYPDKTIYPVASCNEKDFANLMHVYMDAVFFPNIYKKEEIFKQEGWHYELEDTNKELTYNGVVYNEMKGAFSSPDQILFRTIQQAMLPDTPYGVESGGDPEFIPDLTYEEFLDFHRKYYHASNSYIYLYGDMNIEERLRWMDEQYLSRFEKLEVDSEIILQTPFNKMKEVVKEYSVGEDESEENKTFLSYNVVIETSLDEKLYRAFQIIEYVLILAPGAPLKQALLDAGIGKDILSSYDNGIKQPIFSIIAKDANPSQKDEFLKVVRTTLSDIVAKGMDLRSIEGAINYFEFRYREADFGQYPKGLMYGLNLLDSWLYDDSKPFIHICADKTFEFLKTAIGSRYYEELLEKYLLGSNHAALVIVKPSKGLTNRVEANLKEKLAKYKESLSQRELLLLVSDTKHLHEYEMTPASKEENEMIPLLTRKDIGKKCKPLYNIEREMNGVTVLHHKMHTNQIAYLRLCFDVTKYKSAASTLSLLSTMLGYVDTKNFNFLEFSNEINIHTGGLASDLNVYNKKGFGEEYTAYFEIRTKVLYSKFSNAMELVNEMLSNTILEDEKRLHEILLETRSRMEMKMISRGHTTAVDRAMSYFSESAMFEELAGGVAYYDFIVDMDDHFDEKKTELIVKLKEWMQIIFQKENLLVSLTADEEGYLLFENQFPNVLSCLNGKEPEHINEILDVITVEKKNEGFKTPSQVQYVARCGSYATSEREYTGVLRVLKVILSYDYLWNHIRVKGGAYGCMCGFSMSGTGYFTSYRDPKLRETDEVYKGIYEYVKKFEVEARDMTKYVIGAISSLDVPLNPSAKGSRSLAAYLCNVSEEDLQKEREQVLNADVPSIRNTAEIVKAIIDANHLCVIGNERKIQDNKDMFQIIKNLNA
ncbi:MAG: insulinase family protein [Velocimicrobium sp.]